MSEQSLKTFETLIVDNLVAFTQNGLRILLVIAVGMIALRILRFLLHRLELLLIKSKEPGETVPGSTRKRISTLTGILRTIGRFSIWGLVIVISLDQVGVNVGPILAGAGIAGRTADPQVVAGLRAAAPIKVGAHRSADGATGVERDREPLEGRIRQRHRRFEVHRGAKRDEAPVYRKAHARM